jgi:hypothetical protein
MRQWFLDYYLKLLVTIAGIFFILALIGGFKHYTPVPFMDMWDGYLIFYNQVIDGNYAIWWAPANEHRILLARLFFWLDLRFFHGKIIFLYFVNYFLVTSSIIIFYYLIKEALPNNANQKFRLVIISFLSILLFSLIQQENIFWGYQSSFFLAQLLPLISFFLLYLSNSFKKYSFYLYLFSAIVGFACAGSMANGLLAFPMLIMMAIFLRMKWLKIIGLLMCFFIVLYLYFHSYQSNDHLIDNLTHHFIQCSQFVLVNLGGPIFYMFETKNFIYAGFAGAFFIGSFIFFTYKTLFQKPEKKELLLTLLIYILYIIGTAVLAASGRLIGGSIGAVTSRYMTPVLMGWSALFILYAIYFKQKLTESRCALIALLFIPILLFPIQLSALNSQRAFNFEQLIAALALEMRIPDKDQVELTYPHLHSVFVTSEPSIKRNLSIFGNPLIKGIRNTIGQKQLKKSGIACWGTIEVVAKIAGEPHYDRISGWLFDPIAKRVPASLFVVDKNNTIVGYALTGNPRPDVVSFIKNKKANYSGFKGYILASAVKDSLSLLGNNPNCSFNNWHT